MRLVLCFKGRLMNSPLHTSSLTSLPLLARGKVRDNYAVGEDQLLMVASDRISAFDVVMNEPIPGKGELLTRMALFWFDQLADICPNHLTHLPPESVVSAAEAPQVQGRSMLVKRLRALPIEAVVRGYLAGSAWLEYQKHQSVCAVALPAGLQNACELPSAIFTPATKAQMGEHDENISFEQMSQMIGPALAQQVKQTSLALYEKARQIALRSGIIIADTKFEFGLNDQDELVLMDEVLTPDSSRYWPLESYRVGSNPASFDKQFLRDWLEQYRSPEGLAWDKQAPAPTLAQEVIEQTALKYQEAYKRLSGQT
jgi:phosphoribosylaminoimidazole-succinocarboxamide synthase